MTDEELMVLRDKVDGAVRAAMEKELTAKRMELVHRELDAVLREAGQYCVPAIRPTAAIAAGPVGASAAAMAW